MSSKRWLKKNGLIAKKLTIYDALGGTMVKQKAKYVPILDKYVISQVFNEVSLARLSTFPNPFPFPFFPAQLSQWDQIWKKYLSMV